MRHWPTILFFVLSFFASPLIGETVCFGPSHAKAGMIYFHGIDKKNIGTLENRNRKILKDLAEDIGIKIAVPRGNKNCRDQELCWDHYGKTTALATLQYAIESSRKCLKNTEVKGFLGFSNGGYFLNSIYRACGLTEKQFGIISGAAGKSLQVGDHVKACGKVIILQGRKDLSYKKSKIFYERLKDRGFPISFHSFDGGHMLKLSPLKNIIKDLIN